MGADEGASEPVEAKPNVRETADPEALTKTPVTLGVVLAIASAMGVLVLGGLGLIYSSIQKVDDKVNEARLAQQRIDGDLKLIGSRVETMHTDLDRIAPRTPFPGLIPRPTTSTSQPPASPAVTPEPRQP